MKSESRHVGIKIVGGTLVGLLMLPIVVLIGVSLNAGVEQMFPPQGLSLRWYAKVLNQREFLEAAQLTLLLAIGSAAVSVSVSLPAAVVLTRSQFLGREFVFTLLMSPLIVPQVVVGMGFLVTLSALGIFSSLISLAILHCVITLPFALRVVVSALGAASPSLEEAARSLGATPFHAFMTITVPQIAPGLAAAAVFAFVTSYENFTASQFLTFDRTTLPIALYTSVHNENDPTAAALSGVVVLIVIACVLVFNRFIAKHIITGR